MWLNPFNPVIQNPPLELNNSIYTDDYDRANIINNFFHSQTLLEEQNAVLPDLYLDIIEPQLSHIVLSPNEVERVLRVETLPIGKASGPNAISNRIHRELPSELSTPLCSLLNHSLHTGCVSIFYKEANVTPVPQKGDLSIVSNYRPISLLTSEDKVFERLVFKYLYNYLHRHKLISSLQSGFMPGDSTVVSLLIFCQTLDVGKEVRVVFCDMSKAYDRVWHSGLLLKLQAAGVTGEVLAWFKSYLSNRKQRFVLPGAVSDWSFIQTGVPQGSILGPLLFLLYINDIVHDIGSNIRLFADDTSLFIIVEDAITAAACLNNDPDKISQWAAKWMVTFNPSKTESLLISRKTNKVRHPPIFMQNHKVVEVDSHKYLGVVLSSDCSWHQHIKYITDKAWNRINIMRKLKFILNRKSLEIIYILHLLDRYSNMAI